MLSRRLITYLGWFEWIVSWKVDGEKENASLVRTVWLEIALRKNEA